MLTKLRTFASLYRELGLRWSAFRLAYAFRLRTGLIRLQMPQGEWSDYKKHITTKPAGRVERAFFPLISRPSELPKDVPWNKQVAIDEADKILGGELKYFSHQFIRTGFPPNWHHDYVTLSGASRHEESLLPQSEILRFAQNDITKHWSQISDDSDIDIKFTWELNRFSFVYTLVRAYAASSDEKYAEAFWQLILDWAEHNPPNTGPNWMDGQETALRLMASTFGFFQFSNSPSTTPHRIEKFTLYVAAQAERIYKNIEYAISTRSNHTISEAAGLWLVGLLFPELKDAKKYLSLGRELLEREAAVQIFPDGGYSMYSLNYHRFILQIYLYVMRLGELNQTPFSKNLYDSISASINFLYELIDPATGQMPVYGSNDGALVLPLNNCDFTDYRPVLQLGAHMTQGVTLFDAGAWDEDVFWFFGGSLFYEEAKPQNRNIGFPNAGVYILRGADSKAVIRCTDFTSRPSHADQLHMDLWIHGQNIAIDAGTYLYSGEDIWRNGLAHTSVHNTVTVDNKDQMTMVSRFTWTNWSKGKVLQHNERLWQGERDGYKPVSHKRTVMMLEDDRWLVLDNLIANRPHQYKLHWLLADTSFEQKDDSVLFDLDRRKYKIQVGMTEGKGNFSVVRADPNSTRGWRSRYYGHKEPAISLILEVHQPQVIFWSFFGFENDVLEVMGNELKINSKKISLVE